MNNQPLWRVLAPRQVPPKSSPSWRYPQIMQVMRLRLSTETYIWWLGDPTSMSLVISPQTPIHSWCFVQFPMDFACNPSSSWSIRISSCGGAVFDVPIATCGSHVDEIHNLNEPVLVLYHFYICLPWTRDHMGKSLWFGFSMDFFGSAKIASRHPKFFNIFGLAEVAVCLVATWRIVGGCRGCR